MSQPKGVSDILGIQIVKVADLVEAGIEEVGIFMAIEVKKEGWKPPSPDTKQYRHFKAQEDFIFKVNLDGGTGFFAQSVEEVIKELDLNAKLYPLWGRKCL